MANEKELRELRDLVRASRDGFLNGQPYILTYTDIEEHLTDLLGEQIWPCPDCDSLGTEHAPNCKIQEEETMSEYTLNQNKPLPIDKLLEEWDRLDKYYMQLGEVAQGAGYDKGSFTGKSIGFSICASQLRASLAAEAPASQRLSEEQTNWKGVRWIDSIKAANLAEEIALHFAHDCEDSMCGEDADASNCEVAWIEDKLTEFLDAQIAATASQSEKGAEKGETK